MRLVISIIIIAVLSFITGLYMPWWSIALVAFMVCLFIPQRPGGSFLTGFTGVFVLWLVLALFINAANGGILASRIGQTLGIGKSPVLLAVLSAFIGGLVAGFAALTASYLHNKSKATIAS